MKVRIAYKIFLMEKKINALSNEMSKLLDYIKKNKYNTNINLAINLMSDSKFKVEYILNEFNNIQTKRQANIDIEADINKLDQYIEEFSKKFIFAKKEI